MYIRLIIFKEENPNIVEKASHHSLVHIEMVVIFCYNMNQPWFIVNF